MKKIVMIIVEKTTHSFQNNLLVSGGAESEIFIWDLNNPESPMTPGAKSQVKVHLSLLCTLIDRRPILRKIEAKLSSLICIHAFVLKQFFF